MVVNAGKKSRDHCNFLTTISDAKDYFSVMLIIIRIIVISTEIL